MSDVNTKNKLITYSKSSIISLTKFCRNKCGYCYYREDNSSITVPYLTIKVSKEARSADCREALFVSGEHPSKFSLVRSTLDVWGFDSYVDYVNTVCEMSFLEGLLPVIDVGYLNIEELKKIRRIVSVLRIMLESTDKRLLEQAAHQYSKWKNPDIRLEVIKNAGILKVPVTTGILIGIGESNASRKESLEVIRDIHNEYGHIQNVVIQDFVPHNGILMDNNKPVTTKELLDVVSLARDILPEDVIVTVHPKDKEDLIRFIKAGASDLGSLSQSYWDQIDEIKNKLADNGYTLHKRLPIFEKYVLDKWYSRKLGQIMDRYRLLLKQELDKK